MINIFGGRSVDERGVVSFVNDFDFKGVKRFYVIQNHAPLTIRAWHGHKTESKYVFVVSGAARIAWVPIVNPDKKPPESVAMMGSYPHVLFIPPGFYNGSQTLVSGTKIIYFSTATLEESNNDDIRMSPNKWADIWS